MHGTLCLGREEINYYINIVLVQQSGTVPIWVTLSRLPKQVTLNMNFSQQLPKRVTVSVYEQLPEL